MSTKAIVGNTNVMPCENILRSERVLFSLFFLVVVLIFGHAQGGGIILESGRPISIVAV